MSAAPPAAAPAAPAALALFDLDGTLIPFDSDHAFGEFLVREGLADGDAFRRRNDAFYEDYLRGRLDIGAYVDFATGPWRVLAADARATLQRRFVDEVVRPALHPRAVDLVERHRAAGDRLAIVTATNAFVTRPVADAFGIEVLIATELEHDARGRPTGSIRGVPSFREGKIARVETWLAADGLALDAFGRSVFYSDSTNDLPLLERVTHPVATNPGPGLREIALARGWPILDLFA